jgi:hypothetical protein
MPSYDISNIPEDVLKSLASNYTVQVDELRREAYKLLSERGDAAWIETKKEAMRSKNRVEFWREQIGWAKLWASSREQ